MYMYVNNEATMPVMQVVTEQDSKSNYHFISFQWSRKLEAGDKAKISIDSNKIRCSNYYRTYFRGYLVKADE